MTCASWFYFFGFHSELPNLLPITEVCETLLHLPNGTLLMNRLVANVADSFHEGMYLCNKYYHVYHSFLQKYVVNHSNAWLFVWYTTNVCRKVPYILIKIILFSRISPGHQWWKARRGICWWTKTCRSTQTTSKDESFRSFNSQVSLCEYNHACV